LEDLRQAWLSLIVGDLPGNQLLFEWLERKSVPRFALSNTNSVHDEYQQRHFPILKRFDHFYKSFELGHRKPGIEIFQLAAKHAGFAPHECLFIDDTPENVEGARGAGWKAHLSIDDVSRSLDLFQREIG
jgi:FMN phosphatase YigB (HAD superfamily)